VPEPPLNPHGVASLGEQSRGASVPQVRNNFASGSYDGEVEQAAVEIFSSADGLKNADGSDGRLHRQS
jgi:hypothetical protein